MKLHGPISQYVIRFLVIFILAGITIFVGGILDHEIGIRMEKLKAEIITYLEKQFDKKISYESISPSLFMFLEVRELVISDPQKPGEELFRIKTLKVMYNLFTLIADRDPLACVSEINVSNTQFLIGVSEIGTTELSLLDKEFLSKLASSKYNFRLTGSNVELAIESSPYDIRLSNLFFGLSTADNAFALDLTKGRLVVSGKDRLADEEFFSTNLKMKGTFGSSLKDASFMATIYNAQSSYFTLSKQAFKVTLAKDIVDIAKTADKNPIDLHLVYDMKLRMANIDFRTEGFLPLSVIKFEGAMAPVNDWLDFATSSHGTVSFNADTNTLDYAVYADLRVGKNPLVPRGVAVSATLRGDNERIFFEPLVIRTGRGGIYFNGDVVFARYFPEGLLNIVNVQLMPGRDLSGFFSIDRTGSGMSVRGESLALGGMSLYDLALDVVLNRKSIDYTFNALLDKEITDRNLNLSGSVEFMPELALALGGEVRGFRVSSAYKFFTPDSDYSEAVSRMLDNYLVYSDFNLSSAPKGSVFQAKELLVKDSANPENVAIFSIDATPRDFTVDMKNIAWEKYHATGSTRFEFEKNGKVSFLASLIAEDIPYEIKGVYSPGTSINLTGSYDLAASFLFKKGSDSIFTAKVSRFPIPIHSSDKRNFYMSFNINGLFAGGSAWRINCPRFILYDIPLFGPGTNTIETSFSATEGELVFSNISYKDAISEVKGNGTLNYDSFDVSSSHFELTNATTNENYTMTIASVLKQLDIDIGFENFPLERLGKLVIAGSLTGGVRVTGDIVAPVTEINVALVKGAFNGDRMTFNADAILTRDQISFPSVSASYLDQKINNGTGLIDFTRGTIGFNARLASLLLNKEISSTLALDCGVMHMYGDSGIEDFIGRDFSAKLTFSNILVDGKGYDDWSIHLDKNSNDYTLKGGPQDVINGTVSGVNGLFRLEISPPFPIHASAHGKIDGKNIDSVIDTLQMDAKVLNVILGEDIMKFTQGYVTGSDLAIRGILNDPDYSGSLEADDVRFKFFLASQETEPFHANFEFKQKVFSMMPVELIVEGGTIRNDYANFYIDHWLPMRYELSFKTDNEVGLHTVYDFGAVNVDGYAIGSVRTAGDLRRVSIDGDLDVTFCKIMLGAEKGKSENKAAANPLALDINLRFTTRKKVEFYWPSFGFPVLTCIAKPQSKLNLAFSTDTNQFLTKGVIDILRGEIFFFNRNFHLQEGNISFNIKDPADFDPRVTLRASIREFDENNESVDIYFIAENNKLSELRPRFESVPHRSESEIYALLGGSIQQNFDSERFGISMVLFSSEILSQFGFFLSFEQAVRKTFNLDLFSIRTQVFQNILEQGMVTAENNSPESDSLGKYLDDTTITFGRYIGDDLFLMGLVHLKEITDPNQTKINNGFFGVEPEFELVLQLPTPFFNLEWSFTPKKEHIQDLFLSDTKIQFQWHYSY